MFSFINFFNQYFDNRERAILIWVGIALIWAISKLEIRKALVALLKVLTSKAIIISLSLMATYIGGMIYLFLRIDFWDLSLLSETIFWFVGVAFVMFINNDQAKDSNYYHKVVWDNIKLTVFIEFITNIYVLNIWIELLLVPFMVMLGLTLGYSSAIPKYKQVYSFLNSITAIVGIVLLFFIAYNLIVNFKGFASIENLREFLLPLIFTILYLPFIYFLALFATYELIFLRIGYLINDPPLARYTKMKTIISFHLNLRTLNLWLTKFVTYRFKNKEEIIAAIKAIRLNDYQATG